MPALLRTKCPNCNAPLKLDPGAAEVTCEFCHNTSLVSRPGLEPRRDATTMHFKTIDVAAVQRTRRIILTVTLSFVLLPVLGIGTCVTWVLVKGAKVAGGLYDEVHKATSTINRELDRLPSAGSAGSLPPTPRRSSRPDALRLTAPDLTHVDGLEIYQQALAAARRIDSHAQLAYLSFPELKGGTVDVAGGGRAIFRFTWEYRDATKPPGADAVRGSATGSLHRGVFDLHTIRSALRPLRPPTCSTRKLWAAALASGVPENAIARLAYLGLGSRRTRWTLTVSGHAELTRTFDGKTCEATKRGRRRPRR